MSNNFDQFEQLMRSSLDGFEVPYDAGSWSQMNNSLDQVAKKSGSGNFTTIAASITGVGLIVGSLFYFSGNEEPQQYAVNQNIEYKADSSELPFLNNTTVATAQTSDSNITEPLAVQTLPSNNNTRVAVPISENNTTNNPSNNNSQESSESNSIAIPSQEQAENQATSNASIEDATITTANFNIVQSAVEGCEGLMVDFSIDNAEVAGEFLWNFGDGSTSTDRSVVHTYQKNGEYEVVLTVNNGKDFSMKMANDPVRVFANPTVNFSYAISAQNVEPKTDFTNHSDQAISYHWNFGDGHTSSERNPAHLYQQKGTYNVTLEATNVYSCTTTEVLPVQITRKYNLFAPTGFTPNGDEKNDSWIPKALEILDVDFTMTIYDSQSGNMVYENRERDQPWDGRNASGNIDDGIYVWVIVIKDQFGQEDIYKGFVTLRK